eukprot:2800638-Rhodomonas_salina.2
MVTQLSLSRTHTRSDTGQQGARQETNHFHASASHIGTASVRKKVVSLQCIEHHLHHYQYRVECSEHTHNLIARPTRSRGSGAAGRSPRAWQGSGRWPCTCTA